MRSISIVLALVFVIGCSSSEKRTLVVYSPHGKEMLAEYERRFEQATPGLDVQWLDMGSQDVYDRLRTERENPQADVWWGAPSITFAKAEKESLLLRYVPSWESAVEPEQRSSTGAWFGTFLTPEVIMYNTRLVKPPDVPQDWDDLLDQKWKDRIILRYPLASGTMRIIFAAIIQREHRRSGDANAGFEWLRRLDANTKTYVADPTQLYLRIARGEGLLSLWNLPDIVLQSNVNGYPFDAILPRSGTPMITDCIAIVRGTRHWEDATSFYEFVTSQEALIDQATRFYRIPARNDIPRERLPHWLRELRLTTLPIDWEEIGSQERGWMKYWDEQIKGSGKKMPRDLSP